MLTLMKSNATKLLLAGTAMALALALSPVSLTTVDAAGQGQGQRGQGPNAQDDRGQGFRGGQSGGTSIESRIFRGKGERVIIILEDDDSDRPAWAGGNVGENPHARPGGGGKPADDLGDLYGDLIMLVRNPATGVPVTNDDGEYLICQDVACTEANAVPTVEGEVPEGVTPIEVDFGRASVARAPDKVTDKALDDALAKLTADGVILGTDESGRITYTIDGVTSTIDSPLENLALYVDLVIGLASDVGDTATEAALGDLATLDTAAALFAGVGDKTGDITLDYLYYQNLITGAVEAPDTYYDYSDFTYSRDYATDYTYWVSIDDAAPVEKTLDINAYLDAVNGTLPADGEYAALFAAAADDALEVIELVHTQIYTEILPGTAE